PAGGTASGGVARGYAVPILSRPAEAPGLMRDLAKPLWRRHALNAVEAVAWYPAAAPGSARHGADGQVRTARALQHRAGDETRPGQVDDGRGHIRGGADPA